MRLPDQVSKFKTTSKNPCDFIAFNNGLLWLLECKETQEGTLNFSKMSQIDDLPDYCIYEGVLPYFIIWFSKKDKVIAVKADEAARIKASGEKSISLKMLGDPAYNIIDLPGEKKRVYLDVDFTTLLKLYKKD